MDALYQTPLLDCFRRGEVATDIRMMAARGVLAPRAQEQLALLVLLVHDTDPAVRQAAGATLDRIPAAALAAYLARDDAPPDLRVFFASRGVERGEAPADSAEEPLGGAEGSEAHAEEPAAVEDSSDERDGEGQRLSTVQRLTRMTVTERVKTAMRGNREERSFLIRDPNKLVSISVLASPKLTEQEVEGYSKMASVSEDVLRVIGTSRAWTKTYGVIRALTFNPKTPLVLSMSYVSRLVEKDVKSLATDRNIGEPVKLLARKMMQAGQSRKQ